MQSSSLQPMKPGGGQVVADKLRQCTVCRKVTRPAKQPCPCGNDIFVDVYQCRRCRKVMRKAICPDCSTPAAPVDAQAKVKASLGSIVSSTWAVGMGAAQWGFFGLYGRALAGKAASTQQALVALMLTKSLGNERTCEQITLIDQRLKSGRESSDNARTLGQERQALVNDLGSTALASEEPPSYDPDVKAIFKKARAAREANLRWQDRATQSRQTLTDAWNAGKWPALIGFGILATGFFLFALVVLLIIVR